MAKKPKFKLGSEVRALARNTQIPPRRVIPDTKKVKKLLQIIRESLEDSSGY